MTEQQKLIAEALDIRLGESAWCLRLQEFVCDCVASTAGEQAKRLREAANLMRLAPPSVMVPGGNAVDQQTIEMMIGAQAFESAVLALMGPDAGYMLSRGNGTCLATVFMPGLLEELTYEGATPALALLAAHASALAEVSGPDHDPRMGAPASNLLN